MRGVKSQTIGDRTSIVLKTAHMENLSLPEQITIIGAIAVGTFIVKTLTTLYFSRKILFFLNIRGARLTADLFRQIMAQPIEGVNARPVQETIWILNSGVYNLTVGILTSAITIVSDLALLLLLGIGLIIVDPPSLTSSSKDKLIAIKIYKKLISISLKLLTIASSLAVNFSRLQFVTDSLS